MTTTVGIGSRCGLKIEVYHRYLANNSKELLPSPYQLFKQLYIVTRWSASLIKVGVM